MASSKPRVLEPGATVHVPYGGGPVRAFVVAEIGAGDVLTGSLLTGEGVWIPVRGIRPQSDENPNGWRWPS